MMRRHERLPGRCRRPSTESGWASSSTATALSTTRRVHRDPRAPSTGPCSRPPCGRPSARPRRCTRASCMGRTGPGRSSDPRRTGRCQVVDLSGAPDPWQAAQEWMREDLARPVDLSRGPLFAEALLQGGPDRFFWYQRAHHIALDGYGFSLLARRVAELYTARTSGRPLAGGFGSLRAVLEEDAALCRRATVRARSRLLAGALRGSAHPGESGGARAHVGHASCARRAPWPPEDVERMKGTAGPAGLSWSDLVLAATAAWLHRRTQAPEVVLGLPVMSRLGSAALRVPCMAMNIVPLRVRVRPEARAARAGTRSRGGASRHPASSALPLRAAPPRSAAGGRAAPAVRPRGQHHAVRLRAALRRACRPSRTTSPPGRSRISRSGCTPGRMAADCGSTSMPTPPATAPTSWTPSSATSCSSWRRWPTLPSRPSAGGRTESRVAEAPRPAGRRARWRPAASAGASGGGAASAEHGPRATRGDRGGARLTAADLSRASPGRAGVGGPACRGRACGPTRPSR